MDFKVTQKIVNDTLNSISFPTSSFLGTDYLQPKNTKPVALINPATDEAFCEVAMASAKEVDQAVALAKDTSNSGKWSNLAPDERKLILLRFAELLKKNRLQLAVIESLNTGKPIKNALEGDIPAAFSAVRWYAEAIDKVYGQVAPTQKSVLATISQEPIGVVVAIVPWNFPLYLSLLKVAPALAAGNSVILKPADGTPLSALVAAKLAYEAGLPAGAFSVLPGTGEIAGQALCKHPEVNLVSFTGSTAVGKKILHYSSESNMKRVLLECGGKSPNIIFPGYSDFNRALSEATAGAFFNQGQVCCAPCNLFIHESEIEHAVSILAKNTSGFTLGDPLNLNTTMGPVINRSHQKKVLGYIENSTKEGAKLKSGDANASINGKGSFIQPTLISEVTSQMQIAQEEVFGPVLSILSYKSPDSVIEQVNKSKYGLAAYIWSDDIGLIRKMSRGIQAGFISVNSISSGNMSTPVGGFKESGIGREKGLGAFNSYSETKTVWIETN